MKVKPYLPENEKKYYQFVICLSCLESAEV